MDKAEGWYSSMTDLAPARVLDALSLDNADLHRRVAATLLDHVDREDAPAHLVLPLGALAGRPASPQDPAGSVPVRVLVHQGTRKSPCHSVRMLEGFGTIILMIDESVSIELSNDGDAVLVEIAPLLTPS